MEHCTCGCVYKPVALSAFPIMPEPFLGLESVIGQTAARYWADNRSPLDWYYYTRYASYPPSLSLSSTLSSSLSLPPPMTDLVNLISRRDAWSPWYAKGELGYKRTNGHDSPSKELPSKLQKYERIRERQDLPRVMTFDESRAAKFALSKKAITAGTQTAFSSFEPPLPNADIMHREPPYTTGIRAEPGSLIGQPRLAPGTPRLPMYPQPDSQNKPLNLSLVPASSSYNSYPHSPAQHPRSRASVITSPTPPQYPVLSRPSLNSPVLSHPHVDMGANRRDGPGSDPDIEEHFRRSLGRNYPEPPSLSRPLPEATSPRRPIPEASALSRPLPEATSPRRPIPEATALSRHYPEAPSLRRQYSEDSALNRNYPESSPVSPVVTPIPSAASVTRSASYSNDVSITGSVDDHFAKSLGGTTWSRIKAKNSPIQLNLMTEVDDHFMKALGDTWLRIKAEAEANSDCPKDAAPHHASVIST